MFTAAVTNADRNFSPTEKPFMSSYRLSKSAEFWDRHARKYDKSNIEDEVEYKSVLNATCTFLNSSQHALEIGCGTGSTAMVLAPHVSYYSGTDISPEMITICNEKKALTNVDSLNFSVGSPETVVAPTEGFDVVLAFNMIHLVDNPAGAIRQVNKLLKPDGLFISNTPCLSDSLFFSLLRGPVAIAERLRLAPKVKFFTTAQLDRDVESAGFEKIQGYTTSTSVRRRFLVAKKL